MLNRRYTGWDMFIAHESSWHRKSEYQKKKIDWNRAIFTIYPQRSFKFQQQNFVFCFNLFDLKVITPNQVLYNTRCIAPKRVTNWRSRRHFRVIAPVSFEQISQRWRAVGYSESDSIGPRFEPQTSRSKEEHVTAPPTDWWGHKISNNYCFSVGDYTPFVKALVLPL